jgi:hypothetical protein
MENPPLLPVKSPPDWAERNWKWFIPAVVLLGSASICGIVILVFGFMKSSGAYEGALERVRASPAVHDALGAPIEDGFYVTGNIQVSGPSGKAELAFPVSGPKGAATVYVAASKSMGEWHFDQLVVEVSDGGERIEVSETPAGTNRLPDAAPAPGVPGEGTRHP